MAITRSMVTDAVRDKTVDWMEYNEIKECCELSKRIISNAPNQEHWFVEECRQLLTMLTEEYPELVL